MSEHATPSSYQKNADSHVIGNVAIISLSDGTGEMQMSDVFPKVPSSEWGKYPDAISPEGKLTANFGCFVMRSKGKTILVDTGVGPGYPGRLLDELVNKGVSIDEINVVLITHLHPDHVGWNIAQDGGQQRLTFPNARYWIPSADWEHFRQPKVLEQATFVEDMVLPLEKLGALELVEGETAITSEVTMLPTPGHTPGHMSVAISSYGEQGFILGDIVGQSFQAQETAWEMSFDNDGEQARATREAVLERLENEQSLVGGGHFAPPSFGFFVRSEGRRYWQGV